ncbi:hypothetical protein ONZ51_g5267 [Trametes cubensis]|uniref:Mixed lineage kinase domain-containing protein n=1 Tax=Trametes cubensis TaxID=1111947 RepID=A0AAD7XDU3_9APHY|nr:hypothetical protein ONZ51_g5267 [Trametes cubensis]
MPLPIKRIRKVTADDALGALIATSAVTKEIADIMQFPPAQAAAGILLLVFQTIQKIQSNKEECYRLARRCLSMLIDIRDHMSDHWETAPPSLLKAITKFEETLESIHKFMKQEAEQKWGSRLMRKNTIEIAMKQHHTALDDAVRSFQIAALINIQLSLGDASRSKSSPNAVDMSSGGGPSNAVQLRQPTLPLYTAEESSRAIVSDLDQMCSSPVPGSAVSEQFTIVEPTRSGSTMSDFELIRRTISADEPTSIETSSDIEEELILTEHHGFNRYHQSQFLMKGKSRIKSGWWAGGIEGAIEGRRAIMLQYETLDTRRQDFTEPLSPQLTSDDWLLERRNPDAIHTPCEWCDPTIYVYPLTSDPWAAQTRLPQAMLLDAIKNDAALYLQRQMNLSDSKLQDYVERADFRIDSEHTVVMGLPPPEVDNIQSWRNYGLAHSIRSIYLKLLPNGGNVREPIDTRDKDVSEERQRKLSHLVVLARALLPESDNLTVVKERVQRVLCAEDEEDEEADASSMTLRQIRKAAFAVGAQQQAWFRNTVPPSKYSVGDLGYLPKGSDDWDDFVVCCNVFHDNGFDCTTSSHVTGRQGAWVNRIYQQQDMSPFELPGDINGWSVVVTPESESDIYIIHEMMMSQVNAAWNFLLDSGRSLAKQYGVAPEELILVTRVGTEQRFRVRDLRKIQYWPSSVGAQPHSHMPHHSPFQHHGFGQMPNGGPQRAPVYGQDLSPKIFYLFTSSDKDYQSHFSQRPMPAPMQKDEKPPELDASIVKCFAYLNAKYGFLDYVQLHAEDFED